MGRERGGPTAKAYLVDLFEDEQITNVGLEEVVFDEASAVWRITIGFSRSWDLKGPLSVTMAGASPDRSYKMLSISDATGRSSRSETVFCGPLRADALGVG